MAPLFSIQTLLSVVGILKAGWQRISSKVVIMQFKNILDFFFFWKAVLMLRYIDENSIQVCANSQKSTIISPGVNYPWHISFRTTFRLFSRYTMCPCMCIQQLGVTKNQTQFLPSLSSIPNLIVEIRQIIFKWHLINSTSKLGRIKEIHLF